MPKKVSYRVCKSAYVEKAINTVQHFIFKQKKSLKIQKPSDSLPAVDGYKETKNVSYYFSHILVRKGSYF